MHVLMQRRSCMSLPVPASHTASYYYDYACFCLRLTELHAARDALHTAISIDATHVASLLAMCVFHIAHVDRVQLEHVEILVRAALEIDPKHVMAHAIQVSTGGCACVVDLVCACSFLSSRMHSSCHVVHPISCTRVMSCHVMHQAIYYDLIDERELATQAYATAEALLYLDRKDETVVAVVAPVQPVAIAVPIVPTSANSTHTQDFSASCVQRVEANTSAAANIAESQCVRVCDDCLVRTLVPRIRELVFQLQATLHRS